MRVRQLLLVAALVAASCDIAAPRRTPPPVPLAVALRAAPLHYRLSPERMRTLERALERAEQVRERARVTRWSDSTP